MNLFPAIDLSEGKAVRLIRGDYNQKTVYSENPLDVAKDFKEKGAEYLHIVDLDGAKSGKTENFEIIKEIIRVSGLKVEVGGGIREEETIEKYIKAGVFRVILGSAAVTNLPFLLEMVSKYKEKIVVGVDIKEGRVATHGWTQLSEETCFDFCRKLAEMGVKTIICTDISKDGLLSGTNLELYLALSQEFSMDIIASGGVTTLQDIEQLKEMGLYGTILGKALYTGNIDLKKAIESVKA